MSGRSSRGAFWRPSQSTRLGSNRKQSTGDCFKGMDEKLIQLGLDGEILHSGD